LHEESLRQKLSGLKDKFKIEQKHIEDSIWIEIDKTLDTNKVDLIIKIEKGMGEKKDLTVASREYEEVKNLRNDSQRKLATKNEKLSALKNGIQHELVKIEMNKQELNDRDETLQEKREKIMSLKKKIQELEKFKFVLDYKIKELKRDIGPREVEIQVLNEQVGRMKMELEHFSRVNSNLALIVEDLRMRQRGLNRELTAMKTELSEQRDRKKRFLDDVIET